MQKLIQSKGIGILALILSLVIISAVAAPQNTSLEFGIYRVDSIHIELKEDGIANVREELVVDKPEAGILLPKTNVGLEISDSSRKLEPESSVINDKQMIRFNTPAYFPASDGRVFITYTSNHLTSKAGSVWTLRFSSLATPAHTEVEILFPQGAKILELRSDAPRYPANLSSPLRLYPQDSQFSFECDYEAGKTPINNDELTEFLILGIMIIILAIILIILISKRRKREGKIEPLKGDGDETKEQDIKPKESDTKPIKALKEGEGKEQDTKPEAIEGKRKIKESILNMLDDREKEIIGIIENSGEEEITQAYIYKTTGIPKATLSDIMGRLERRNIIERSHEGRTKWIRLKNWVFN